VDAIKKQLTLRNKDRLALEGLTLRHIFTTMWAIAYYMDQHWALREIQLAFNEVNRLFYRCIKN
jgi:hypothetical protein